MKCPRHFPRYLRTEHHEDKTLTYFQCPECKKTTKRSRKLPKQTIAKPRKRMRARSPKRAAQEAEYLRRRIPFLKAHPICPITGQPTTQIHHKAGREGIWLLLEEYWMAVSDEGHDKIEKNRKWATAMGYLLPRRPSK